MPDANKIVYAKWEPIGVEIAFYDEGREPFTGTHPANAVTTISYGSTVTLTAPTRPGYDFVGWFRDANCTSAITQLKFSKPEQTFTVYAKWTPVTVGINYYDEGEVAFTGTHGTDAPTTITFGTTIDLVDPTREGSTFIGWYSDKNCTEKITRLSFERDDQVFNVYAKWETITADIAYYDEGGATFSGTYGVGTAYEIAYDATLFLVDPTRDGYSFNGWYSDENCTQQITELKFTDPGQTFAVYAKWTPVTASITYYDEGEVAFTGTHGVNAPIEIAFGKTVTLVTPTRENYNFIGWYSDKDCTQQITELVFSQPNQTFNAYAKWEAQTPAGSEP